MNEQKYFSPDWLNMNLSEMVEKEMALKVIPTIQFIDKGKANVGFVPSKPLGERTPIDVLKGEVRIFRRCLRDLSGILKNNTDKEKSKKIKEMRVKLRSQVRLFNSTIKILVQ